MLASMSSLAMLPAERPRTGAGSSPVHFMDVFKTYYGPMLKAFAALDKTKQKDLAGDMHALIARMNVANDGTMVVPSEYLEVVITKR